MGLRWFYTLLHLYYGQLHFDICGLRNFRKVTDSLTGRKAYFVMIYRQMILYNFGHFARTQLVVECMEHWIWYNRHVREPGCSVIVRGSTRGKLKVNKMYIFVAPVSVFTEHGFMHSSHGSLCEILLQCTWYRNRSPTHWSSLFDLGPTDIWSK